MPRFAVVGATGQLGQAFCRRLGAEALPLTRADLDITQTDQVRKILLAMRPDVVLNCAAYNWVDRAETECDTAFAANALGVRHLAHTCRDLDCLLVHFSTNYVFGLDAERRRPYVEDDNIGPINLYGVTKLAGEFFARSESPRHLVIRTAALFGRGGHNFVRTVIDQAREKKPLRIVNDQVCTPTYAGDLVTATLHLVKQGAHGLFHVTSAGSCTWHEFARTILELAGLKAQLAPVTSEELAAPARRPAYSVMENHATKKAQLPPRRPWQEALAEYLEAEYHAG